MSTSGHQKMTSPRAILSAKTVVRRALLLGALALLATTVGCSIYGPTARNTLYETHLIKDQTGEYLRNCCLANSAWSDVQKSDSTLLHSDDYEQGFKAGFKAYLEYGSNAGVPPIPPKPYWWMDHQGPEEFAHVQDWHAGFVHGMQAARESGYREMIAVPSLVPSLKTPDDTIAVLTAMSNAPRGNAQDSNEFSPPGTLPKANKAAPTPPPSDKASPAQGPISPGDLGSTSSNSSLPSGATNR
jgi:hypothetical protein